MSSTSTLGMKDPRHTAFPCYNQGFNEGLLLIVVSEVTEWVALVHLTISGQSVTTHTTMNTHPPHRRLTHQAHKPQLWASLLPQKAIELFFYLFVLWEESAEDLLPRTRQRWQSIPRQSMVYVYLIAV